MKFNIIDLEKWPRKTHYEFYTHDLKRIYNVNKNIDITKLIDFIKNNGFKFYPTFIYLVSKAVNTIMELKIRVDDSGKLGYWDYVVPAYTIFHEDDKTFSCIYTEYDNNFSAFYAALLADMNTFKDIKGIRPKLPYPKNHFQISCTPWLEYTSLSMQVDTDYLVPFISWGKYMQNDARVELPFTIQLNHAIADGYHVSILINLIQELALNPNSLLI